MASPGKKLRRQRDCQRVFVAMQKRYPDLFSNTRQPTALKIGIHLDLIQVFPEFRPYQIRRFLWWWTNRKEYRAVRGEACAGTTPRVDCWGNKQASADQGDLSGAVPDGGSGIQNPPMSTGGVPAPVKGSMRPMTIYADPNPNK